MDATITALLGVCILYPRPLRDLLMWLALTEIVREELSWATPERE